MCEVGLSNKNNVAEQFNECIYTVYICKTNTISLEFVDLYFTRWLIHRISFSFVHCKISQVMFGLGGGLQSSL